MGLAFFQAVLGGAVPGAPQVAGQLLQAPELSPDCQDILVCAPEARSVENSALTAQTTLFQPLGLGLSKPKANTHLQCNAEAAHVHAMLHVLLLLLLCLSVQRPLLPRAPLRMPRCGHQRRARRLHLQASQLRAAPAAYAMQPGRLKSSRHSCSHAAPRRAKHIACSASTAMAGGWRRAPGSRHAAAGGGSGGRGGAGACGPLRSGACIVG